MAGLELLYGRHAVREALLARRRRIYRLFIAAGTLQRSGALADLVRLAAENKIPAQEVERAQLERMAGSAQHHGVMAEAAPYPYLAPADLWGRLKGQAAPLILLLDYLQDPQNLGTLLRTAEAVGVDGVIIPQHRAAGVTPAVVNASAGATEHLAIAEAPNLVRTIKEAQAAGLWIVGLEKVEGAPFYTQVDLTGPLGLVIGGEGKGMSRLVRESCDLLMQLPMAGRVNSLNAAAAGSIALYEIWRQRDSSTKFSS